MPIDDALEVTDSRDTGIERAVLAKQLQAMGRPQDRRVLRLILQGATSRDVARELHISKTMARKVWQRVRERLRGIVGE